MRLPGRRHRVGPGVEDQRLVAVFEVRVEDAAGLIDGVALGLAAQGDLGLDGQLGGVGGVDHRDRLVARGGRPHLLGGGHVLQAVGRGGERHARAAGELGRVDRAHLGVGAVADVDEPLAHGGRARPHQALGAVLPLARSGGEALDAGDLAGRRVEHVHAAGLAGRDPDAAGRAIDREVVEPHRARGAGQGDEGGGQAETRRTWRGSDRAPLGGSRPGDGRRGRRGRRGRLGAGGEGEEQQGGERCDSHGRFLPRREVRSRQSASSGGGASSTARRVRRTTSDA